MSEPADYVNRYKPSVLKGNDTTDALFDVEKEEVEKLYGTRKKIFDNLFIETMDVEGIARQEEFFNIKPNAFQTLEERRMIVLNKLLYRPPFTRQNFQKILENIWGKGKYIFQIYPDDYRIVIDIDTNNPVVYLQFSQQIREVIPANLYLVLSIQWTHLYLGRNYTYQRMEEKTYGELSEYAMLDMNS